jgi:RNA polymerase sigma-70 factor (ECF subfamily)
VAERRLGARLHRKFEAADLVQDTFLKACRRFASFRGQTPGEFYLWLRKILLRDLADRVRFFVSAQKRQLGREIGLESLTRTTPTDDLLPAPGPGPRSLLLSREQMERMRAAVGRLPETQQQVVVLHVREEKTFDEIGRKLNRSAEAARKLWNRALDRLQEEILER